MAATILQIKNSEDYNFICFEKSQAALEVIIDMLKRLVDYEDPEFDHYREYVDTLEFEGERCEIAQQVEAGKTPPKRKADDLKDFHYNVETDDMRVNIVFGEKKIFFFGYFSDRKRITPALEKCTFK